MGQAALDGNRVEFFFDAGDASDFHGVVHAADLIADECRPGEDAGTGVAEGVQQGAVVAFGNDARREVALLHPAIQEDAHCRIGAGHQHRCVVQGIGKAIL